MYMSAFALNEFLKVAPLYGVSPSTAVDRYRIFGGVIRPALVKLEETEAVLRANVSDAAARELLDLNLISTRSRTSHTLVHLVVGVPCCGGCRECHACILFESALYQLQFSVTESRQWLLVPSRKCCSSFKQSLTAYCYQYFFSKPCQATCNPVVTGLLR